MALNKVARCATAAETSAHFSGEISGSGSSAQGRSAPLGSA